MKGVRLPAGKYTKLKELATHPQTHSFYTCDLEMIYPWTDSRTQESWRQFNRVIRRWMNCKPGVLAIWLRNDFPSTHSCTQRTGRRITHELIVLPMPSEGVLTTIRLSCPFDLEMIHPWADGSLRDYAKRYPRSDHLPQNTLSPMKYRFALLTHQEMVYPCNLD